ncbi:MAG: DUF480 domain-containing protein [Symploca sp. SIO2G7]|nr:DUF480 domain-containing protein [Symploca sp. SIO2G7]
MSSTPESVFNAIEARVLGCLIEKQSTTPENYPLTLNALVTACNQKTSRSPVMRLESGKVGATLRQLEQRKLVERQQGARAERWAHRLDTELSLTAAQRVLLGLLMLRGANTLNELMTRSERMFAFDDVDELHFQLDRLAQHGRVRLLDTLPGQREPRYVQLLTGEPDLSVRIEQAPGVQSEQPSETHAGHNLLARVDALEARIAEIETFMKRDKAPPSD